MASLYFTRIPKLNVVANITSMSRDDINKVGIEKSNVTSDIKKLTVRAGIRRTFFTKNIMIDIPDIAPILDGYYDYKDIRTISAVTNENLFLKNAYVEKYIIFNAEKLSNTEIKNIFQDSKITVLHKDVFGRQYKNEQFVSDLLLKQTK